MNRTPGEYPVSSTTVIVVGGLCTIAAIPLFVIGGALGILPLALGLPLLISGLIRESRERKVRLERLTSGE